MRLPVRTSKSYFFLELGGQAVTDNLGPSIRFSNQDIGIEKNAKYLTTVTQLSEVET